MTTENAIRTDFTNDPGASIAMTAAQRGIYYAQQLDPDVPMSVAAFAEFRDHVDADVMQRAITATTAETESALLRLVPDEDGEPTVLVDRMRNITLGRRDFSDADDPRTAALTWIDEHRSQIADLYTDPLLQTSLLRLGERHYIWYCWGHHLAFDGYAAMYMMLRVAQHYTAIVDDTEVPPASSASTADIAEFDATYRSSAAFDDDRRHWTGYLDADGGAPESTSLSSMSAAAAPTATVRAATLPADLVDRIRSVARDHQVRAASLITAAVATYLARFNDRDAAMLSLPVAARDRDILRTSAGLTSNVVPIRAAIADSGHPVTAAELLRRVNGDIKAAVRHQKYRHEDITGTVLESPGGRRGFFGPMVNVMLFFEHIDFGPLRGELNVLSTGPVEDASINVYDGFTGGMRLDLEANPNVYSFEEIADHHDRIVGFLQRFVDADPDAPVTDIPMMSDDESAAVAEFTAGEIVDRPDLTLLHLLADAATGSGTRTALLDTTGAEVSYAEFTRRAERVADGLRHHGVGPESVVGVAIPRSIDQVVALHAVIRAGGAYLPIDPEEPPARLEHILTTAAPALVISDGSLDLDTATVTLDDLSAEHPHGTPPARQPHPDHPAYVLFTSGSTGKPKGVIISHRAIVNRLLWMADQYRLTDTDRVLQKTPATFDVSVWEFFWPIISGAALMIPSPHGHRDPWYLREIIDQYSITTAHFVPSMLATFAAAHADDPDTANDLRSLRRIITSGEALTPDTVAAIGRFTDAPVHNLYGPTEAAVDVTNHDDVAADADTVPIGAPIANTSVRVLDHRLAPQPIGAIGELYLGGVQLARGYRNRPELTAGRFVADPFSPGARLYRTGDLVRRRRDGELEYLGRSDSQVKIRGQRVELGEIEAALTRLDGVRAAGVVLRDDIVADGHTVVGYVAGTDGLRARDLRAEVAALVPEHMVPTLISVLDELPTTANGKLDRRALPAPALPERVDAIAPDGPVEQLVSDTVGVVLGCESISMSDNFFALGGDSLSATRVAARLSRATGRRVDLRVVFDTDDLAGIAARIDTDGVDIDRLDDDAAVATHLEPVDGPIPLSPAQHRLWLAERLDPESAGSYHIPFTVRLVGVLDAEALHRALTDVVGRHEPLRTTVAERDGTAYGVVADAANIRIDLPILDVTTDDVPDVREFASTPFDLAHDLPIRARLVRSGTDDHRLTVVIHHLAADGWSLAPLAADLATAYRARRDGTTPAWAPLPVSYTQVSASRQAGLDDSTPGSPAAEDLEFWTAQLAGVPGEIELPLDRPRSTTPAVAGARLHTAVTARTHQRVAELAGRHGVTGFMVLHAAVAALLRTYATTDDITVGTPVSGRGDADLDALVGMFVNTVALRTQVRKDVPFTQLLADVRNTDLAAFGHADLPFDRLVTELNPGRSANVHPFFQVSVAVEDSAAINLEFAELSATASRVDTGHTKFDLQFTFAEHTGADGAPAGIGVDIDYATALFERDTVRTLSRRLLRLIEAIVDTPDTPIGDIGLLEPHEQLDLVPAVGAGRRPVEHLTKILARAVETGRDQVALCDSTSALTYGELDAAANRLARLLIAQGAGPERYVAVSLPRSVDWIVTLWAVARTGAAWVPVDPRYPTERIAFMLEDSGAQLLVSDSRSVPETTGITTIVLDDPSTLAAQQDCSADPITLAELGAPQSVDQPAYLIYTSGTTGTPKGVVVSHRGLADFAAQQVVGFGLTGSSRTLHLASPSFDASVLEILMATAAGATMHIAPADMVGGTELADLMRTAQISHAFLTPSLLTTMSPDDVPDLEALVIGGEHPNPEMVRRWSAACSLYNAYGPTETTVVATISDEIDPADPTVTIGRPIRGIAAMVLDERLQPVAPGAVGELYIAGGHLARGYHGVRPLTSKRFIANPYGDPGDRMYRTGDLVRWTADRELEFRGRADHQTKIRGHRIELGEIDAALVADDAVVAAVTTTVGEGSEARLVSYVTTAAAGHENIGAAVRSRLAERLPRHMVPASVIELDEIPTTPIGKVDFRALPAPDVETSTDTIDYVAPRTAAERLVADLVAAQLGVDVADIGREHDFFDLGGSSLSAIHVVEQLPTGADGRISVRDLFDHSTIAEIAGLLDDIDLDTEARPLAALHHDPDAEVEPGPAQQQLWFLNQTAAGSGHYNIAFALDLRGELDVDALTGALAHTIDRHEPLRTVYPDRDGRPGMAIKSAADACPDLTPVTVAPAEWDTAAADLAAQPFDLTRDTPIRAALHRVGDTHKLTIVVHHIAADGWSMAPLARDLAGAYADLRDGRSPSQAPLPVGYRDHLRWQAENLEGRFDELAGWWGRELDALDPTPILLPDSSTAEAVVPQAESVEVAFDLDLRRALAAIGEDRTTEFITLHTVFAVLLHRLHADPDVHVGGRHSDVVIGTPVAGRPDPRLADLVGMFVNSVVLRTPVDGSAGFATVLDEVRQRDLEALSRAEMPFEQVVATVNPPRTGRHPIFTISLSVDPADPGSGSTLGIDVGLAGLDVSVAEVNTGASRFDLELRLRGNTARFTYATERFSRRRVETIAAAFVSLSRQIVAHPDRPIDDLDLDLADHPSSECVATPPAHLADLLQRTVSENPDTAAVDDGHTALTYAALERRAQRWALALSEMGIGAEDVVAVALDRSTESVTATWAVALAGATLLPLDPRYPADRLRHMIDDARTVLGISSDTQLAGLPRDKWWLTTDHLDAHSEATAPRCRRPALRNPDSAAYIVYTSGSTGKPKGVIVTHRGLAAFAQAQQQAFAVGAGDRTLHFASPGFDAAMLEFLLAFTTGATMVVAPATIYGGDELVEFLADEAVTHAFITPAALAAASAADLPKLRMLGVGGEASTPALVERWGTGRDYRNNYGPTETTIVSTISEPLRPGEPITIGAPIAGCTALVLDHRLRPVPPMVPGELYLAGPGVARGYLGRPDLTAGRFVPVPTAFADTPGVVMYRTGDIVHRDTAGALTYHGRSDNQVKVRGFRIELDEVSGALADHPAVDFATTLVRGSGAEATLASYVTLHAAETLPTDADLRAALRGRLPRQMIPSSITILDRIPLTTNGKLDRAALPEPTVMTSTGRSAGTAAEVAVVESVAEILGIDAASVDLDDDFFGLGGTSLQATALVSRLRRVAPDVDWRVADIFDTASIAAFAARIPADAELQPAAGAPDAESIGPRPERIPLAPMQRRLWSVARANPDSTDYLMPFAIRLSGPLDVGALRESLVDLVSRHAVLRTIYPLDGHSPVGQVLDDPGAVVGDLTTSSDAGIVEGELLRPLDVTTEPPLRAAVIAHDHDDNTLVLVIHHIAADGASLPLLVADLVSAYRERVSGRETVWSAAEVDYRDYAIEVGGAGHDDTASADRTYWADHLTDAPAETTLPATVHSAPTDEHRGATLHHEIEDELRSAFADFARDHAVTPFSVLHTALAILLHRLGVGDDLVIGTPVANRTPRGGRGTNYSSVVGMFVNTLALRTRLSPHTPATTLLEEIRATDLAALDHLDAAFDDVVAEVNPVREPGRHPLFQVALSVHDFADSITDEIPVTEELRLGLAEMGTRTAKFDLQFTITGLSATDRPAAVEVNYASGRYRERDVEQITIRFLRVLRALLTDADRPIGDLRITDPLEVAELSPASGPAAASTTTFEALLAAAVRANPEGWAAVTDGDAITYADLDARSNRLARVLLGRGAGDRPESVVAMAIPRSIEAVIAVWAIVKTGAAYVPVDPTYPAERIEHMLADSGAALVVTMADYRERLGDAVPILQLDAPTTRTRLGHSSPAPIRDHERIAPLRVDQLAYIIYTSGSTGRPKGVLVPHSGLAAVHEELRTRMGPETGSRVLHFASPSFDASVLEFLLAAGGAGALAIVPPGIYGGRDLERFIERHRVSHAFITPAAVASMDPKAVRSLHTMAVGGEDFGGELVRRWAPGRTMLNVYGPTETTVITTGSAPLTPDENLTIGTPNNGVGTLVLDRRLHPVPPGVVGELYLLGDQVTRGYHRQPTLTATRFVSAPMVTGEDYAGQRMYRTGDLVRRSDDGRIEYVGRADGQVQIRGFRVELGEIDDALAAHPSVDFAVTVVDESGSAPVLRSYLTTVDAAALDDSALRAHLAAQLPRHMMPTSLTRLDDVPLTPTGKLDRTRLPAVRDEIRSRAPRPGFEQQIAEVFAEILEVDAGTIGADDGFFDLGGNSLLAGAVAARCGELLGREVPVAALFTAPTPAELAALADGDRGTGFDPLLPLRRSRSDMSTPPLFVVHPAIGLSWSFAALLPHLPEQQALYALQNPALSGMPASPSIAELAADYVARIRAVSPDGPFHLLGWSLGGLIAHEMAVQLEAAGEEVASLTLLDSFVLADRPELAVEPSLGELLAEFGLGTDDTEPGVEQAWRAVRDSGGALGGLSLDEFGRVHDVFRAATDLAADWRPGVFGGDMTFVTAADDPPPGRSAVADWAGHVRGAVDEIVVECTHARMLLPENVTQFISAIDIHTTPKEES
ncbi:amino acid adenylation domain-containing protein [Gordonia sp. CPCC 205515]|uniref:non-ribosomal peptide synthetase n=1 Tax=Gordonia sp. CPCC 205515 TaxID=3140791 RepID=UPI003AF36B49